ncbi:MAG: CRISPR-associated helicase Cas3' [Thermofilaceae archaeon]|nr:CRISPR-associated helicase Cas3' [Thermofilaceae archaeon]
MYWSVVEKVVRGRGRELQKYKYFEETWRLLNEGAKLVVVQAPTGCGKTEAVSAPFLYGLSVGARGWFSLVHALPSRSLVVAMRRRLAKAVKSLGVSRATVTVNYGELLALKPYLEGDVAVTTYDTLLYAFYGLAVPGYHVLLPLSKLAGSLLVLDEVQLLQDNYWYSMSLLPVHVSSLVELGVQVVIMSATLPEAVVNELKDRLSISSVKLERVTSSDLPHRGKLQVELKEGSLPVGEGLDDLVLGRIVREELLPALIVVNTVEKAVAVYRRLLELEKSNRLNRVKPLLLHSRLTTKAKEEVERLLEGGGDSKDLCVLVATQVVEAGLDMDFRFLATELSPVDSLIQRLGRAGRRRDAEAVVFLDVESGRSVYPELLLNKTLEVVKGNEAQLSDSVSRLQSAQDLVDKVYTDEVIEELKESLDLAKRSMLNKTMSKITDFPRTIFSAPLRKDLKSLHLLRLGIELRCLYLAREKDYKSLVCSKEVDSKGLVLSFDEVKRSIVRISQEDSRKLPPALLHKVDGEDKAVVLKVEGCESGGLVNLMPYFKPPEEAVRDLESGFDVLLLLNPDFYEFFETYELGVVKPWGRV